MSTFGDTVGAGILSQGVTEILKGLSILVSSEIALAWGVNNELQDLKETLDMILAVMIDAEKKQAKSEAVRLWLQQLKDIAYEAEDILDEHAYEGIHQQLKMSRKRDKVRSFFSSSNPIVFRSKIAHEIKAVNEKFNKIAKRKKSLGLQIIESHNNNSNLGETSSKLRETDSTLDVSLKIIGRENDKSNIITMLLRDEVPHNQGVQVIPIVGMGGLGKTTLAQLIYNDDIVEKHFDLKMWVCVSDDFDVKKLFVKTIESITNSKCDDVSNIDVISLQLQQHLSGKKYLLVLDDVWNKKRDLWVNFRKHLQVGANGSKVIVTTRSDSVASIMGGGELHSYNKLGVLAEDESWSLFKERAAVKVETPSLTSIGKELVAKCGGLPLAIVFLGSLLRGKDEIEWNKINQNQIWNESSDEDESRILPVLKLSYDYLPSHLKQCFSYFSLFTNDSTFSRLKMIQLWMAEGFILPPSEKNNKSMLDVGNEYFNILLNNSFFQDVEKDVGQVLRFKMHDLVHDLAKDVAGDREFLLLTAHENMKVIPNIRRLSLHDFSEGISKIFCSTTSLQEDKMKLRTLFCYGTVKRVENAFDGLKRLRVLDLHQAPNIEEIPSSLMKNLKHLRYLNLARTQISKLPECVTRLYHLQTLALADCVNLKELPKGIGKLINLRHLFLPDDINMPKEIGELSSLQRLYPCSVGNNNKESGFGIEDLEKLNLLDGFFIINDLENVRNGIEEAQRANLIGKKNLTTIILCWPHKLTVSGGGRTYTSSEDEADVLEALQPHPNLKSLIIDQYFGVKLPQWMGGDPLCLPNLVNLQLTGCLKCEQLVGFGKLPSLKELHLENMDGIKCLGKEFYYNNNNNNNNGGGDVGSSSSSSSRNSDGEKLFPSLKELSLTGMSSLEEWVDINPPTTRFPCLEKMRIQGCPKLRITPTRFPSLQKLYLKEINERVAVPLITTNLFLNSLQVVELVKISELRYLPYGLLKASRVKDLRVTDCLDFQGFFDHQNEEEEEEEEGGGFTSSLEILFLVRLPALKLLPDLRSFTSLEILLIDDCESLKALPAVLSLAHLKEIAILNMKDYQDFVWQNKEIFPEGFTGSIVIVPVPNGENS